MNFKFDLFMDVIWLGTLCGIISTIFLQKLKETTLFQTPKINFLTSIIINFSIGFIISRIFTNLGIKLSIIVGIITWIGAETIYEKLSKKNMNQINNYSDLHILEADEDNEDIENNIDEITEKEIEE